VTDRETKRPSSIVHSNIVRLRHALTKRVKSSVTIAINGNDKTITHYQLMNVKNNFYSKSVSTLLAMPSAVLARPFPSVRPSVLQSRTSIVSR